MSQDASTDAGLRPRIADATKAAMKAKDSVRLSTLRLVSAAVKDRDIDARAQDRCAGIDDAEILSLMSKMVKQREESASTYENNGRLELAERERAEIDVIREFMPTPLTEAELEDAVRERLAGLDEPCLKDMGRIMGSLKTDFAGRIDMGRAGAVVKRHLCAAKSGAGDPACEG